MLATSRMTGFLITRDYDLAQAFFVGKLEFEFVSLDQFALVLRCGKNMVRVSKLADFTPAQHTVLGWEVDNIEAAVAWLKQRDIITEKYPFMKASEDFWTAPSGAKVAWFKDPDGNVLSVSQHV